MQAAFHVMRYLRGVPNLPLEFRPEAGRSETHAVDGASSDEVSITAYTDADWGGDLEDRKSTTGFVVLVYVGCAVSWQSKKQATVALSTAEAEYNVMAVSQVLQEVKWIHQLMAELGLRRSKSVSDDEAASESMS
jgi:hypothetical protein